MPTTPSSTQLMTTNVRAERGVELRKRRSREGDENSGVLDAGSVADTSSPLPLRPLAGPSINARSQLLIA